METKVILPQLGESVVEGTIIKWLKKEGETVKKDEPLVEISTDKVDTEIPSPEAGTLAKVLVKEGETVAVGEDIAVISDEKEGVGKEEKKEDKQEKSETGEKEEKEKNKPAEVRTLKPAEKEKEKGTQEKPEITKEAPEKEALSEKSEKRGKRITPVVAKLIAEDDIDINKIEGSGIEGRVTKKDILNFLDRKGLKKKETVPEKPEDGVEEKEADASGNEEVIEMTRVRKSIAEHMVKSKQTSPHVTTVVEVDMTRIVRFREKNKERFQAKRGVPLTYTAIIVKAAVNSLQRFPRLNSSMQDNKIIIKKYYHIGVATATEEGLVVPVMRGADRLDIPGIAKGIHDLAKSAREKKLPLEALQGGTFTITNPGTYGAVFSTPIIHQPQAAILGVEAIRRMPVVVDDAIAIHSMMNLCLSYDHRIIDGLDAGKFLQDLKKELEQGLKLEV